MRKEISDAEHHRRVTHECLAIRLIGYHPSTSSMCFRPVHPARRSRAPSLGQRTGVRRQGRARLDRGCRSESGLYRAGQPLGERLHRELQRSAPGRAAQWGDFLFARGGQDRGRNLAAHDDVSSEHTLAMWLMRETLLGGSCSAGCFGDLEDSSASLRAVEQLRSRRLKTQGPSAEDGSP